MISMLAICVVSLLTPDHVIILKENLSNINFQLNKQTFGVIQGQEKIRYFGRSGSGKGK
jgi:hypothetical protein